MNDLAIRRLAKIGVAAVLIAAVWTDGLNGTRAAGAGVGGSSHVVSVAH